MIIEVLMSACTMSSDYGAELLLGTSPVLTSTFQTAGASCFTDYSRCSASPGMGMLWDNNAQVTTSKSPYYSAADSLVEQFADLRTSNKFSDRNNYARTGSLRRSKKLDRLKRELAIEFKPLLLTNPSKSCLRQIEEQEDASLALSPSKEKKKVSFADALGRQLAQIKLIRERPDCPPLWSQDFIEKVTGGLPPESPTKEWELSFAQPVSNYISFKNKLDTDFVTLENAVIDATKKVIKGTISVRNISFHKEVTVRYSVNSWQSTSDCTALYVPSPITSSAYDLYDRFSFEFPLPSVPTSDKIEFCIRFASNGTEYWDNNGGRNYTVVSFRSKNNLNISSARRDEAYRSQIQNNSEFAFWNVPSASSDSPYW